MPHHDLPPSAFWSRCLAAEDFGIAEIHQPKFPLPAGTRIATAGSCFAQHIGRALRTSELTFIDTEPAPRVMPPEIQGAFGYGIYSARFGNIYGARQLRQLIDDATAEHIREEAIWQRGERYSDALRPGVEPEGFASTEELIAHRRYHLRKVRQMVAETDVFIFTLGMTECWMDSASGTVFPSAPGVIAGTFDPERHVFYNASFQDIHDDLTAAIRQMRTLRSDLKVLFTVSPVPLTATFSGQHVLRATTYAKSTLRAVAEEITRTDPGIDYFPAYEIITGAPFKAQYFDSNMRTVTREGVAQVMRVFSHTYGIAFGTDAADIDDETDDDLICEEALNESLSPR